MNNKSDKKHKPKPKPKTKKKTTSLQSKKKSGGAPWSFKGLFSRKKSNIASSASQNPQLKTNSISSTGSSNLTKKPSK